MTCLSLVRILVILFAIASPAAANAQRILLELSGVADVPIDQFVNEAKAAATSLDLATVVNASPPSQVVTNVRAGTIGMAIVPLSTLRIQAADAMMPPWTYLDPDQVAKAIASEAAAVTSAEIEKTGAYVLQYWQSAFGRFASTSSLRPGELVKGRKVIPGAGGRQSSQVIAQLGGTPVGVGFAETFNVLQAGNADSIVVATDTFERLGYIDVLSSFVDQPYQPIIAVMLVNKETWSKLPFEVQIALADAAKSLAKGSPDRVAAQDQRFKSFALSRGRQIIPIADDELVAAQSASATVWSASVPDTSPLRGLLADNRASVNAPHSFRAGSLPESRQTVYFVTSRVLENPTKPKLAFGGKSELNTLRFGSAVVKFKAGRALDSDLDEFATVESMTHYASLADLRSAMGANIEITVYVHGYYNTFVQALGRAATIKQDLGLVPPVLLFSWPSEGALLAYGSDESSIDIARENVRTFFPALQQITSPGRTSIVAHSLGGRLVMNYIDWADGRQELQGRPKLKHIVFAATDITNESFTLAAPKLVRAAESITIYASENDRALYVSRTVHSKSPVGRPDKAHEILILNGMSSIDASDLDKSSWFIDISTAPRHSYMFEKPSGVRELSQVLSGAAISSRALIENRRGAERYWKLRP